MIRALVALQLVLPSAGPDPSTPTVRYESLGPERAPVRIDGADGARRLCRTIEPPERLRPRGDAVARGEAESAHGAGRAEALRERYEVTVPAAKLTFAPYDPPARRLTLQEPVQLPVGGVVRLWLAAARGLPVEADAEAARRVLEAQRKGGLGLSVVFDLPEDATCGSDPRGRSFTLPIDPVAWRWLDGETVLAHGGAAAERPLVPATRGARPRVEVGEPLAGPKELEQAVGARAKELEACYEAALAKDPALDGVLVVELGGAKVAIAADSVGDASLADCVRQALAPLAPVKGGKGAVPIRFELAPPGEGGGKGG